MLLTNTSAVIKVTSNTVTEATCLLNQNVILPPTPFIFPLLLSPFISYALFKEALIQVGFLRPVYHNSFETSRHYHISYLRTSTTHSTISIIINIPRRKVLLGERLLLSNNLTIHVVPEIERYYTTS